MPSKALKKRCNKCGRVRLAKFYAKRSRSDRRDQLAARCVDCVTEDQRRTRERRKREREEVASGKSLPRVHRVPMEPFQAWVQERAPKYESMADFCEATEMNERRVYDLLNGRQKTVTLEVVDRALTREGSAFLWELYPELYP